jgi:hypothetical protein
MAELDDFWKGAATSSSLIAQPCIKRTVSAVIADTGAAVPRQCDSTLASLPKRALCIRSEEHEVAAAQAVARRISDLRLLHGTARQVDAEFAEHVLRQSRTVERFGAFSAPHIRTSDHPRRQIDDVRGHEGAGRQEQEGQ